MNNVKKIIVWAMLSIMLQVAGLLFLDQVIFKESYDIDIQAEEIKGEVVEKNRDIDYDIPYDAKDIKVSDDTRYISYFRNDKLMLLDTKSLKEREITTEKGKGILAVKWILDEDILVIVQKELSASGTDKVNVINYNVKYDYEQAVTKAPLCNYYEGMEVNGLVQSTKTNTTYVGISRTGFGSSVYRIDVNYNANKILNVGQLKAFKAMQREDILIYQDSLYETINASISGTPKDLGIINMKNYTLIDVDDEGIIYLGKVGSASNDEITSIVYGHMDANFSTWATIELDKPKRVSDVYISSKSEILVNDRLKGKIINMIDSKAPQVEYKGQLLQLTEGFICSTDNGKIIMKSLNEDNALDSQKN
ncbi:MAG: dipeptidyl-peptidase IV [Clostridium sp.]|nr:dipeptidyl-peptidase IV [Clostridium sp.]MDY3827797.1 dipeptidyl-peptidase IV [Clostridium sp.]